MGQGWTSCVRGLRRKRETTTPGRYSERTLVDTLDELEPEDWELSSVSAGCCNQDVPSHGGEGASVTPLGFGDGATSAPD